MSSVFRELRRFLIKLTPKIMPSRNRFYIEFTLRNLPYILDAKIRSFVKKMI